MLTHFRERRGAHEGLEREAGEEGGGKGTVRDVNVDQQDAWKETNSFAVEHFPRDTSLSSG